MRPPRPPKSDRYPMVLPMLRTMDRAACAELRFHPVRKWRADFAMPTARVLIEIDGGAFSGGRHTRGAGFVKDQEKHRAAVIAGWRVLRFIPADITNGTLLRDVRAAIGAQP